MSALQLALYVVFLTVLLAWSATGHVAVRAHLSHTDSTGGFTKRDLLRRMASRTRSRVVKRWSPPRPRPGGGNDLAVTTSGSRDVDDDPYSEYLIHLGIGTPSPQSVALALDTSSDLIWTQCGCAVCFDQPFPVLDNSASSGVSCFDPVCARGRLPFSGCTLKDNLCFYAHSYSGHLVSTGKIYEDTFTFQAPGKGNEAAAVPSLRFGCGMYNKGNLKSGASGVAGFGRGPMSLPSQLKVRRFSHCFTTIGESRASPVFLGSSSYGDLEAQATGPIQSTPFALSPQGSRSSLYYLSLKGITVGKTRLPFDASTFELKGDGSGGTVMDSDVAITAFPRAVFQALREELVKQLRLPVLDVADELQCFNTSSKQKAPAVPKLILHLEGADWDLRAENYVLPFDDKDVGTGLCVVISSSGDSDVTIIGNFQQQNMHMEYDLGSNKLGFVHARCDKL